MAGRITHTTIRNPLTLIGIFASLAETSGTVVLGSLDKEIQKYFVWFLMIFPFVLVCMFFFVLYNKYEVLYSPSERGRNSFDDDVKAKRDKSKITMVGKSKPRKDQSQETNDTID